MSKRYNISKKILLFWTAFIGVGALFGSIFMLIDPTGKLMGMDVLLPYFQVLPFAEILFQNYIFSGIALLIVNGITNISSFILILLNKKMGMYLGTIFGLTLMLWIIIQFIIFPINIMDISFFVFGLLQLITGYVMIVGYKQQHFDFNKDNYKNINDNSNILVVYFSRMGYTKKIAYEVANKLNASIYEVISTEKINGNLGFWWCGRFGMHGWPMAIQDSQIDLSKYDKVYICSPIWVFQSCAPIKEFCNKSYNQIKDVTYIFNHFMNHSFSKPANDLDKRLNIKHTNIINYKCRFGKYKCITKDSNIN